MTKLITQLMEFTFFARKKRLLKVWLLFGSFSIDFHHLIGNR